MTDIWQRCHFRGGIPIVSRPRNIAELHGGCMGGCSVVRRFHAWWWLMYLPPLKRDGQSGAGAIGGDIAAGSYCQQSRAICMVTAECVCLQCESRYLRRVLVKFWVATCNTATGCSGIGSYLGYIISLNPNFCFTKVTQFMLVLWTQCWPALPTLLLIWFLAFRTFCSRTQFQLCFLCARFNSVAWRVAHALKSPI